MKTDNNASALAAKVRLRLNVLAELNPARVLDCFCGAGEMYRQAWAQAAEYAGCDERPWSPADPVSRFVVDNRRLLRALDLQRFNVFDLDAYGSPWEQMMIIADRRRWAPGERGAVVLTDGSALRLKFGDIVPTPALRELLGAEGAQPGAASAALLLDRAESAWLRRAGVRLVRSWRATRKGGTEMRYSALVIEGL